MATHAKLSPSGSSRWMACPGSIQLIDSLGIEDTSSKYADEGTAAHSLGEICLKNGLDAHDYKGKVMGQVDKQLKGTPPGEFKVTKNMADAVQDYLDYIRERISEAEDLGYEVEMLTEVWCSLESLGIPGLDGGTSDCILIFRMNGIVQEVEVVDYKHGQGVAVDVIDNTQAQSYGTGVIKLPELEGHAIEEGVTLTIVQPRAFHSDGPIRSWETDKESLLTWCDTELVPAAKATHKKNPPIVPGDKQCRFCPASGRCNAQLEKAQEVAVSDFSEVSTTVMPNPAEMTMEQIRGVMDHAAMLRSFIVAVEEYARNLVDTGTLIEGYKLVRKKTNRRFIEDAEETLALEYDDSLVYEKKMRSMTAIEKDLKKQLGKEEALKVMSSITEKSEGSLVIAPLSDKREAVTPTIVSDFDDL